MHIAINGHGAELVVGHVVFGCAPCKRCSGAETFGRNRRLFPSGDVPMNIEARETG